MSTRLTKSPAQAVKITALIALITTLVCACFILGGCQNNSAKQQSSSSSQTSASASTDYSKAFPSWNSDSATLQELIQFVKDATNESSANYIPPSDRIATFDMDGTILCEKDPFYFEYSLALHRILDDPTYSATDEERAIATEIRQSVKDIASHNPQSDSIIQTLNANTFAGMDPKDFRSYVIDYAKKTPAFGFEGMTYAQSFFKPMIEVIKYLRDNGFDVWMVSASEREIVRALTTLCDFPLDHVIGTDVPYVAERLNNEAIDKYNMPQGEKIVLGTPVNSYECGRSGKPSGIIREIGKYPVLAFGNTSGDYSMLNYSMSNPDYKGKGFFVLCDDVKREYGNKVRAQEYRDIVTKEGWTPISMENDWKTIFGDQVKKVQLQGRQTNTSSQSSQSAA